ncbi:MAG: TolC family protein [Rubricoccaceae bacterium]|nr:TolC family protein [Rubricoccaceae bacterium]
MRLLHRASLLALLALAAWPAAAQQVITFDEAIRLGLARSLDLREARLGDEAAALNVTNARADVLPLPYVEASVQPTQRYGLGFDQTTGQLTSQTSESVNVGVSASLNLFDGFRDQRALAQARIERDAAGFTLERASQQVAFDVASRFLQVLLDAEIVRIREESLEAQRRQLADVEALVEAGVRARADVFGQQASVAEAEVALLQARQAVEVAKTALVEALQLDPFGDYVFTAPALDEAALAAEPVALEPLLRAAYERRPDLRARERQIAAAEASVRTARAATLPSVDLFASLGTGYSSLQQRVVAGTTDPTFLPVTTTGGDPVLVGGEPFLFPLQPDPELEATPLFTQFADNRSGSLGLSVTVPLFDRFQTRRQVQQAEIEVMRRELALERQRQAIATEVRQAVLDYRLAGQRLDATAVQVSAAEAALEAEEVRYELGTGTLVALELARARLTEAQSARAQAVYEFVFRRAVIAFALGELDPTEPLFE